MAPSSGDALTRGLAGADLETHAATGRDRAFFAMSALLFVTAVAGTIAWCGPMAGGMPMPGGWTMSMAWMRMPGQTWLVAGVSFAGMWLVMMVAMMTPSLAAMLAGYRRASRGAGDEDLGRHTLLAGAGYFCVWVILGVVLFPIGVAVAGAEMRWAGLARAVPLASGVMFALAGCLQLTRWKTRHLLACRDAPGCCDPVSAGAAGAWRHGLRLGAHCLLCCSGFMLAMVVGGVMDLAVMGAVAVAITAERLAPRPVLVARLTGLVVVALGIAAVARAVAAP